MNLVNDLDHFSALVKDIKRQHPAVESNCYLLPEMIQNYTRSGLLYWQTYGSDGLLFFADEKDSFHMYYFMDKAYDNLSFPSFPKQSKGILLDLIYKASDSIPAIQSFWIKQGFQLLKVYKRIEHNQPGVFAQNPIQPFPNPEGYELIALTEKYKNEVLAFWNSELGLVNTILPDQDEILSMIRNQQLFGMIDKENNLAGVIRSFRSGNVCNLERLVIGKAHRNRKLGNALMQYCMIQARDSSRIISWVAVENIPIINLTQGLGFHFDGRVSAQLFMEKG